MSGRGLFVATDMGTAMVVECCLRSAVTEQFQFLVYSLFTFIKDIEAHSVII